MPGVDGGPEDGVRSPFLQMAQVVTDWCFRWWCRWCGFAGSGSDGGFFGDCLFCWYSTENQAEAVFCFYSLDDVGVCSVGDTA